MGSSEGRGGVMGDNGRNKSSEGGAAVLLNASISSS